MMEKNLRTAFPQWNGRVEKLSDKLFDKFNFHKIDTVHGECENCKDQTILVAIVSDFYRCTNCGYDTKQHVNGSIRYLKLTERDKELIKQHE